MNCSKKVYNLPKFPKLTELYYFISGKHPLKSHRVLNDVRMTYTCLQSLL